MPTNAKSADDQSTIPPRIYSFDLTKTLSQLLASWADVGIQTLPRNQESILEDVLATVGSTPLMDSEVSETSIHSDQTSRVGETEKNYALADPADPSQASAALISPPTSMPTSGTTLPISERIAELAVWEQEVAACKKCSELVACRTKTVFGAGNPAPRLVFLGEAPGADEDRQGIPFVGAAGQLLDRILKASGIKREEVYILNTIKCRPPGNRNPSPEELDNCWEYTRRQLEILNPDFICCLGLVASKRLLNTDQPLGKLRQRFHDYGGKKVIVTYHPSYLLRTESAKKHVWADMKMLLKEMGMEIPN